MKLIIAGFTDYNKLDKALNELIESSQNYLFTILCGGTGLVYDEAGSRIKSIGEIWAEKNGAPAQFLYCEDPERLLIKTAQTADYILYDGTTDSQWAKRLLMMMRALEKHGTIVK